MLGPKIFIMVFDYMTIKIPNLITLEQKFKIRLYDSVLPSFVSAILKVGVSTIGKDFIELHFNSV